MTQVAHAVSSRGESSRQVFDTLTKEMPGTEAVVVTSLPRGGLQIVQPQKVAESLTKAYGREFQTEDEMTWRAILGGAAVRANPSSRYVTEFLASFGYQYAAAAPLRSPVLEGYPGAIQLWRTREQGDFSDADLRKLTETARRLDNLISGARASRAGASDGEPTWAHRPELHEMIFDKDGKIRAFAPAFEELDDRLRQQIKHEVRQRLAHKSEEPVTRARVMLPDSHGDHWALNFVTYRSYPALGSGPFVFVTLLPTSPEWRHVRPADFQADPEMARLIPALKFMYEEYHRGPTLVEIAKTLHLSPFHFHRRFTELLGLTPKHFMLECQIHEAKGQLVSGEKNLAQISDDCGFAHQSHFTSRFKQATGLTPTRWRRMARERVGNGNGKSHS
jgi:AraC-like DNA-binding protein